MVESITGQPVDPDKNRSRLAVVYSYLPDTERTALQVSLEVQERHCRRRALDNSWCIVEYIRDTASSYSNRPGLQRLGELLSEGQIDVVLAYSPDRVCRHRDHLQQLLAELDQAGASLEFVVDHATLKDTRQH